MNESTPLTGVVKVNQEAVLNQMRLDYETRGAFATYIEKELGCIIIDNSNLEQSRSVIQENQEVTIFIAQISEDIVVNVSNITQKYRESLEFTQTDDDVELSVVATSGPNNLIFYIKG